MFARSRRRVRLGGTTSRESRPHAPETVTTRDAPNASRMAALASGTLPLICVPLTLHAPVGAAGGTGSVAGFCVAVILDSGVGVAALLFGQAVNNTVTAS